MSNTEQLDIEQNAYLNTDVPEDGGIESVEASEEQEVQDLQDGVDDDYAETDDVEVSGEEQQEISEQEQPDPSKTYELIKGGKRIKFSLQELMQLATVGLNTKRRSSKTGKIEYALKENNVPHEAVNALMDLVVSKDKRALAYLAKTANIDLDDLHEIADGYTPKEYRKSDKEIEWNNTIEEIYDSPKFNDFKKIYDDFDPQSKQFFAENPAQLKILIAHLESGLFDEIQPIVEKKASLDKHSQPDIAYIIEAIKDKNKELEREVMEQNKKIEAVKAQARHKKSFASIPQRKPTPRSMANAPKPMTREEALDKLASLGIY